MLNSIPILGWLLSFLFSSSLAVPFYFLWNHMAPKYLPFLPPLYSAVPFWDCVWLFMLVPILKSLLPTLVSITQTTKTAKENG